MKVLALPPIDLAISILPSSNTTGMGERTLKDAVEEGEDRVAEIVTNEEQAMALILSREKVPPRLKYLHPPSPNQSKQDRTERPPFL